jgi:methylenetetrahydrofolate--tRNA-(uracil-5-)-methyltransferase
VAGLLCGVEGYVESAAMGLMAAVMLATDLGGFDLPPPPPETALGSLYHYLQRPRADDEEFVPTNMNLSLMPPLSLPKGKRKPGKRQRRLLVSRRGLASLREWKAAYPTAWIETGSMDS